MTSVRTTAPAIAPVSLDDAKTHLRVDSSDEDGYITGLIGAAVAHFDATGVLGRAIITQTWAEWVGNSPGYVRLSVGPFQSLTSIEYYDTDNALQSADIADFEVRLDGDFVMVLPKDGASWPSAYSRRDAIKITYVAGYGDAATDVPESIVHAIKLTVGHWYQNREAVSETSMKEVPLAVEALIGAERGGWYGG